MLKDFTVNEYLAETASPSPVPGGGSAAALSAALAASLTEMVAGLTVVGKAFASVAAEMHSLREQAQVFRARLADCMQLDADAYQQVIAAYRLPRTNEEEKSRRGAAIQAALQQAARVPLEVARLSAGILAMAEKVVTRGNPNAVTDGAVAAMLARTAGLAALYNVKINLASINDHGFVQETTAEVNRLEVQIMEQERSILRVVPLLAPK
jgi:methenyltetrahydrofolate cyclohydrolase